MGLYQVYSQVSQIRHASLQMEGPLKKNFLKNECRINERPIEICFPITPMFTVALCLMYSLYV